MIRKGTLRLWYIHMDQLITHAAFNRFLPKSQTINTEVLIVSCFYERVKVLHLFQNFAVYLSFPELREICQNFF